MPITLKDIGPTAEPPKQPPPEPPKEPETPAEPTPDK